MKADLLSSPPPIPKENLSSYLKHFGVPYFLPDRQSAHSATLEFIKYDISDLAVRLEELKSQIQKAKGKRGKKPPKTDIEQILYIAHTISEFHDWLRCTDILSWLKRRILGATSDVQELLMRAGFDVSLVEAWQSDMSPFIRINIPNKSTGDLKCCNFGREAEHFLAVMTKKRGSVFFQTIPYLISYNQEKQWACGMPLFTIKPTALHLHQPFTFYKRIIVQPKMEVPACKPRPYLSHFEYK